MIEVSVRKNINKRFAPLYISTFFQSFVLWYTIEKLFMRSIGFSNTGIGIMIALYSAVMLIVETPSGILADRWSRKGVLMLASVCLAFSALAGALSHGIGVYLVAAVLWGVFFACYSGMYDSIVYDTLAEEAVDAKSFDYFYGRLQLFDGIGLMLSSLAGAYLASVTDLRTVYFWSIPFVLIPLLSLARFREPTLHKQQVLIPLNRQIQDTFRAVTRNKAAGPIVVVLILRAILSYSIYEFSQLWLLQLHTQTAYYGLANAVVLGSVGIGGILVSRLHLERNARLLLTVLAVILGAMGLIFFRSTVSIVAAQLVFSAGLISIYVIFSRLLHDHLPASIRAGASSAASTLGRLAIIPTALLIGYTSQHFTIYKAAYILLGITILMAVFISKVIIRNTGQLSTPE